MSALRPWPSLLLVLALIFGGVLWLRWPSLGFEVWNVDEAIHAAVARTLLDGGVLYRDAIDQRTPLSYYVVAGLFALAGDNNIVALHILVALLIATTAFLLLRLGAAWSQPATGAWAAALYCTLATSLYYQGDANAFQTEWLVALFATGGALCFAHAQRMAKRSLLAATGLLFGLAFLSKQPALLDALVPSATLVYAAYWQVSRRRAVFPDLATFAVGFSAPVLACVAYFAAKGALSDAIYYTWTYNLVVYGPEIGVEDRVSTLWRLFALLAEAAPVLLPVFSVSGLMLVWRLVQRQPTPEEQAGNPTIFFLCCWGGASLLGAASGGRGFDHYFIQCLPPLCLITGWGLASTGRVLLARDRPLGWRLAAGALVAAAVVLLVRDTWHARSRILPEDSSRRVGAFIKAHTLPNEKVFVWGYHPELYLFSNRKPASRFVYASFISGLVPWTNVAPDRDTTYAVVPGALETLLRDLGEQRPAAIVDCSAGPNRHWQKYPLTRYPKLAAFVAENYVLVDPGQFRGQGYDLYLIRDSFHRAEPAWDASVEVNLSRPQWFGPTVFTNRRTTLLLSGESASSGLRRLELLINGEIMTGVTFAPTNTMKVQVEAPFDRLGKGSHTVEVRAWGSDGSIQSSGMQRVVIQDHLLPESELAPFGLPRVAEPIPPRFLQAPHGATAEFEDGRRMFYAHAPSILSYPLPTHATQVMGGFGIRAGAYAANHPSPTDGAEFRIELVSGEGARRLVFSQLLQPATEPGDRGIRSFSIALPPMSPGEFHLEFIITAGPQGNAASDWTYWSDLLLETSR